MQKRLSLTCIQNTNYGNEMSKEVYPDLWSIVKVTDSIDAKYYYRVFAIWRGSFAVGQRWKLNSGIKEIIVHPDHFEFVGLTDTRYICAKELYGNTLYGHSVINSLAKSNRHLLLEVLDDFTDADVNMQLEGSLVT